MYEATRNLSKKRIERSNIITVARVNAKTNATRNLSKKRIES